MMGVSKAGANIDFFCLFVANVTPDGGGAREPSKRLPEHDLRDPTRLADQLAVRRRDSPVKTIVDDHPPAKIAVLERRIMDIADGEIACPPFAIKRNVVPRVVRRIAAEASAEKIAGIEFGITRLLDADDVAYGCRIDREFPGAGSCGWIGSRTGDQPRMVSTWVGLPSGLRDTVPPPARLPTIEDAAKNRQRQMSMVEPARMACNSSGERQCCPQTKRGMCQRSRPGAAYAPCVPKAARIRWRSGNPGKYSRLK